MDLFVSRNSKILVDANGKFKVPAAIPPLIFQIEGNTFPPAGLNHRLYFKTRSMPQRINIDFGDGSPVFSEDFTALTWITGTNRTLYNYADASRKTIKMWFSSPDNISEMEFSSATRWNWVGLFPLILGIYNLDRLYFRYTKFESFPVDLSGGTYRTLRLSYLSVNNIDSIPRWITSSRINNLYMLGGFELNDLNVSNLDKLINIQDLQTLCIENSNIGIAALPNNLKDISTLRIMSWGNNPFTEIPLQINACKQVTQLAFGYLPGYTGEANNVITSWGVGLAEMPNLKTFTVNTCQNVPTDIVTGIETSGLSRYETSASYKTVQRINASIVSAYNKVSSLASMAVGDTLLRNLIWINGSNNGGLSNAAPTGVYKMPSGYIQGLSNGAPANALEMIYVLTKQYYWTITVNTGVGNAVITYNRLS